MRSCFFDYQKDEGENIHEPKFKVQEIISVQLIHQ